MIRAILITILIAISIQTFGQESLTEPTIADRYPGGADTLRKFLAMNAWFPESAVESGQTGLSIASLSISPNGTIVNSAIHNRISEDIDRSVSILLNKTDGQWLPVNNYDEEQTYYFQISFVNGGSNDNSHVTIEGDNILDEILVTALGYSSDKYQNNKSLNRDLQRYMDNEKFSNALTVLEEFIRRDPFNIHYYELKAKCYEGLKWTTMKTEVERRIQEYHNQSALSLLKEPVLYGNIKIIEPLKNGTFSIKELSRDSSIIYSGKLVSKNPEVRQGRYYFFNENGKVTVIGEYQNDIPVGTWNYLNEKDEIETSLDYSAVVKFLVEEDENPLVDSTFIGRNLPLMNPDGSFAVAENMPLFKGAIRQDRSENISPKNCIIQFLPGSKVLKEG